MTIDKKYVDQFINVTSKAAIASSHLVGKKDKMAADQAAVDAMRSELNKIDMTGEIVIGEGSQFLKKLIQIIRISLFIPLFGSGKAKIQPVYVDDIARAIVEIIVKKSKEKNIYELCGPVIYNYRSFYKLIFKILRKKRFLINFPFNLSLVFFSILEKTPINILTKEQLLLFKEDNIQSGKEKNFNYLGISPKNVSEIIKNIHKLD